MNRPDPDTRYRAPALDKGLDILEILAAQDEAMTRAELVAAMDEVRDVCSVASSVRKANKLRVRLPLHTLTVAGPGAARVGGARASAAPPRRRRAPRGSRSGRRCLRAR